MNKPILIHSCPELIEVIQQMGFLPLLDSGIRGYSAEEMADEDCRYVVFSDGGWDWSLLTTPERLLGREACRCPRTPEESFDRLFAHFKALLPTATDQQIRKLI